jgi:alanine-glyoxylate transaminase/serine-glyoxylate transaminase/serine-pyruvate transaminase
MICSHFNRTIKKGTLLSLQSLHHNNHSSNLNLTKIRNMTSVPPPEVLKNPPNIPQKMLFGPGPSNMSSEIRHSMNNPLLGHLHVEFCQIMDDCRAGIQYLFQTKNPLTFAVSGTGHAGMECAIMNLLEFGETFLVIQNGIWGARAAGLGKRLGLNVQTIIVPEGSAASMNQIREGINEHKPKVLFVCHGESSTGVAHPLKGISEICREHDTLLLVDTVASIGATKFDADALGIDCVYTATQKVLNAPPGLAPISFSPKAVEKIKNRKTQVVSFYFDALELGNYWGCFGEPRRYHHTGMISLVYSLRAALSAVAKEGIENEIKRHEENIIYFHQKLEESGFKLFVEDQKLRLPCLTTIRVPDGVEWKGVMDKLMAQKIEISGGLGPTLGKIWRIGTFGINSDKTKMDKILSALKAAAFSTQKVN